MAEIQMDLSRIKVDKIQLIETLRRNREGHKALYDEAVVAYKEAHLREAERIVERARQGIIVRSISIPVPEEHTDDFDRAIEMLEWAQTDSVWLNQTDFSAYVRNDWGWAKSFANSTASYVAGKAL